ncbi:morphogenesis protein [Aspergillus homomorphus CBS 101889]|uniref:Morphogenesis protein n=1 Tax=Aspergillus homomorphus (strain CBS 101889) TaxID=1450537 RepID=A0A395HWI6_ASPHC|nr:morphogenesis protein [Aspergillus homomorphus CBS 101889]RAL12272.1 morphogenesis protein [Aspergillus homomorphus CBS 101889]
MPFFTRVFRSKDANASKKNAKTPEVEHKGPAKPTWTDAWQRTEVAPEEVQELLHGCTQELKARALQTPFLLLPFRPSSDASAARTFIRNYFNQSVEKGSPVNGEALAQDLRLTDPIVICSVLKWCWSRLPGGVVTWEAYELFKVGEQDSQFARDAFSTFIPISVDSDARAKIITDFFDLLAAVAAHGKSNGLGGRKLSRYAGWWAFDHSDTGSGFEAAYKNWASAADATSHLFFAYLRSLSPDARGIHSISALPIALQSLIQGTEYPPETPTLLQVSTTKVVMIVDTVSPTPFALLRRAKNFEYRDSDRHLQEFASFEDPVGALTDECLRVLKCIASTNQSAATESETTGRDEASWSRFENFGFGGALDSDSNNDANAFSLARNEFGSLKSAPQSGTGDLGRPTTPSWADFMSSGFGDETILKGPVGPLLLPPDKVLPPLSTVRGQSSQSHKHSLNDEPSMEPAELASITTLDLDDSFWWVWISSLAGEEPTNRKAVFGRCALLETIIKDTKWLVLEEQVKGAAPEPEPGAYIVEKKRFFGFSTRKKGVTRRKSSAKKVNSMEDSYKRSDNQAPQSKTSIAPDQHARIQAAAAALQKRHREEQEAVNGSRTNVPQNARYSTKTNSIMTLQPSIMNEASQAMKWATNYDKNTYRTAYLSNSLAGTGSQADDVKDSTEDQPSTPTSLAPSTTRQAPPPLPKDTPASSPKPAVPRKEVPVHDQTPATSRNGSTTAAADLSTTESLPKQSMDSDESGRKLKKKTGNTGFKSMFGTIKKKSEPEPKPPAKITPPAGSAVAAARAALEDRARAAQEHPIRPGTNNTLKKKPVPLAPAAEITKAPMEASKADVEEPVVEQKEPEVAADAQPAVEVPKAPESPNNKPKIRRQAEYDALSRIDTKERAAADQEFSQFDQGPLVEQPAFVPESPVSEEFTDASAHAPVDEPVSPPKPAPAAYDRWAQIRQNAAERAAQIEARGGNDYTSDENTSEEESFESRAARIKARVAELTGNMQAASQP